MGKSKLNQCDSHSFNARGDLSICIKTAFLSLFVFIKTAFLSLFGDIDIDAIVLLCFFCCQFWFSGTLWLFICGCV